MTGVFLACGRGLVQLTRAGFGSFYSSTATQDCGCCRGCSSCGGVWAWSTPWRHHFRPRPLNYPHCRGECVRIVCVHQRRRCHVSLARAGAAGAPADLRDIREAVKATVSARHIAPHHHRGACPRTHLVQAGSLLAVRDHRPRPAGGSPPVLPYTHIYKKGI